MNKLIKLTCIAVLMLGSAVQAMVVGKEELGWKLLSSVTSGDFQKAYQSVEMLLMQGAPVDARNYSGSTPLILASFVGNKAVCELLIAHNAQVYAIDNKGKTALIWAAIQNHKDVCELLIDAMLKPTREQRDRLLFSQSTFHAIRQQNRQKALAEIAKIENETLRNELIEYVNRK